MHYHDGVNAGNLLAPDHSRSFVAFRYTFAEYGRALLCREEFWFEYAVLRTEIMENVDGGISCVTRLLMHQFYTSTEYFLDAGAVVDIGDGPNLFYAQHGRFHPRLGSPRQDV